MSGAILTMPSGYACSKSYRTCKSSWALSFAGLAFGGQHRPGDEKIENQFQGFDTPHKLKLATAVDVRGIALRRW